MAKKHGWGRGQLKEKGQRRQAMGWAGFRGMVSLSSPFHFASSSTHLLRTNSVPGVISRHPPL